MKAQLANGLSVARMLVALTILATTAHHVLVWWLFATALTSDYLDGFVARQLHAVTPLGDQLDSVADTLLALTGISYLVSSGWLARKTELTIIVAVSIMLYANHSSLWGRMSVRLIVNVSTVALYGFILAGVASRAYGWHTYYIGAFMALAVPLAWLYRDRIQSELALEPT